MNYSRCDILSFKTDLPGPIGFRNFQECGLSKTFYFVSSSCTTFIYFKCFLPFQLCSPQRSRVSPLKMYKKLICILLVIRSSTAYCADRPVRAPVLFTSSARLSIVFASFPHLKGNPPPFKKKQGGFPFTCGKQAKTIESRVEEVNKTGARTGLSAQIVVDLLMTSVCKLASRTF